MRLWSNVTKNAMIKGKLTRLIRMDQGNWREKALVSVIDDNTYV